MLDGPGCLWKAATSRRHPGRGNGASGPGSPGAVPASGDVLDAFHLDRGVARRAGEACQSSMPGPGRTGRRRAKWRRASRSAFPWRQVRESTGARLVCSDVAAVRAPSRYMQVGRRTAAQGPQQERKGQDQWQQPEQGRGRGGSVPASCRSRCCRRRLRRPGGACSGCSPTGTGSGHWRIRVSSSRH